VNEEAWPTPASDSPPPRSSREPLPRVEDLPIAEQGYDQQSVKAAFDSFYRHAAQLDAALRTLEAVDSFHRQAAALRGDLRVLRTAGWTQRPWPTTPAYGYGMRAAREGISPVVWRIAGEAAFLIAVAVVLGVAKVSWWLIVLVMAFAWLLIGLIEWAASRDFTVARTAPTPMHPVVDADAASEQTDEGEPVGWMAFEEAQEPSDAMTMIGASGAVETEAASAEPAPESEPGPEPPVDHVQDEAEPVAEEPHRHWWSRRSDEQAGSDAPAISERPRHVRVLPPEPDAQNPLDPWERGFDEAASEPAEAEPEDETGEGERTFGADVEQPARRRFRRR